MSDVTDEQLADIEADVDLILADSNGAPYLRLAASFPLLVRALRDARDEAARLRHQLASDQSAASHDGYSAGYSAAEQDFSGRLAIVESEAERLRHLGEVHHADVGEWRAERDTWRGRALKAEAERDTALQQLQDARAADHDHKLLADEWWRMWRGASFARDELRREVERLGGAGRCGVACPAVVPGAPQSRCDLRAGHAGWHAANDGAEWVADVAALAAPTQEASEHE